MPSEKPSPTGILKERLRYGTSVEGRPLEAICYGDHGPLTMLLFTFHGDEREVRPVGERLAEVLDRRQDLFESRRAVLVLEVNPDGWAHRTRQNAKGVDLNRNFPIGWEPGEFGSDYYPGPTPLSEPESSALAELIDSLEPSQIVSVHQPFDWLDPDGPQSIGLARAMAAASGMKLPDTPMKPTPGSFGKYCNAKGIAIVTVEMPEVDASRLEEYWATNLPGFLAALTYPPPVDC